MKQNGFSEIILLSVVVLFIIGIVTFFLVNQNKHLNSTPQTTETNSAKDENTQRFFTGQYKNEENSVEFTIPDDLKLIEPNHTKNFVSLYPEEKGAPYTGTSTIFVSFYQHEYEEEIDTYILNYGTSAVSKTISHKDYTGRHVWGVDQDGPGHGQENGVFIINKDGKALLIRYLDINYKAQATSILNSLQLE